MKKPRKQNKLVDLATEMLGGKIDEGGTVDFGRWADGMLAIAGVMWHLRNVDAAPIRSARNIGLPLSKAERNVLVGRTEIADDLKDRLRQDGELQVSLDELAAVIRSFSPLLDANRQDQDILRLCVTCLSTFTDAIKAAATGPEEKKKRRRNRRPKTV